METTAATINVAENTMTAFSFTPKPPYEEIYWIASEVIISAVLLVATYLLISVSAYTTQVEKKKTTKILLYLVIATLVTGIGRFVANQVVAFLGWQKDTYCVVSTSISFFLYSVSSCPIYVFLWLRQNTFYSDSRLRQLVNKKVHYISKLSLFLIIATAGSVTILFQIPSITGWDYRATDTGCRDTNDQRDLEILPLLVLVVVLFSQLLLLSLLVYPLVLTKRRQERMLASKQPTIPRIENKSMRRKATLGNFRHRQQSGEMPDFSTTPPASPTPLQASNSQHTDGETFAEFTASDMEIDVYTSHSESECETKQPTKTKRRSLITKVIYSRKAQNIATATTKTTGKKFTTTHRRNISTSSTQHMLSKKIGSLKKNEKEKEFAREKQLANLIKKVTILACVCVFSDVCATALQLLLVVPELVYLALYDVSLFVNIICVLISFKEWPKMLSPPCAIKFSRKLRSRSLTSQASSVETNFTVVPFNRNKRHKRGPSESSLMTVTRPNTPDSLPSRTATPDQMTSRM
ncbi:unnamed protein product [Clavelina lepadiformis]|uniref:G-protein coupled receptors family 1 profile domain-containing protein n=1 Tax=Clavelina lepadiformis TaxID=159417 RepID=A0ABP0FDX0_CLALP